MNRWPWIALTLAAGVPAWAATDGPAATATYDAIRKDPAQHALYCEMEDLKAQSIKAQMSGDRSQLSTYGRRITEIEPQVRGYSEAIRFEASKSSDFAYFKTPEGKALNEASKALALSCKKKQ